MLGLRHSGYSQADARCIRQYPRYFDKIGAGLEHVVDVHAYLTDMSDYEGFNEAYSEFFGFDGPTRFAPHAHFPETDE